MLRLRRNQHEFRMEILPLIDVIFLLLTFFIYALVLMVRAEILPMELREFASADPAQPAPAVTISIDGEGALFLDREPIDLDAIPERLRTKVEAEPETIVYIAAAEEGTFDRLPVFFDLYDRLAEEGLDIRLVGRPKE